MLEALGGQQQALGKYAHHMVSSYIIHVAAAPQPRALAAAQQALMQVGVRLYVCGAWQAGQSQAGLCTWEWAGTWA